MLGDKGALYIGALVIDAIGLALVWVYAVDLLRMLLLLLLVLL